MDNDDYEAEETNLVKDLRKQLKEAQNARKQFEEELAGMKSEVRQRSVADILKSKGVNPKVAKFVPNEIEDEEAISGWLEENSELFGGPVADTESGVSNETRSEMQRANALQERSVSPDKLADLEARMSNAGSLEEINTIMSEYQKFQL